MFVFFYLVTLLLLIYGVILVKQEKKRGLQKRLSVVFQKGEQEDTPFDSEEDIKRLSFSKRIIEPTWKQVKRKFQKNLTNEKKDKMELKLLQAGSPFHMTAVTFRIVQLCLLILLPVLAGLYAVILQLSMGKVMLFGLVGFLAAAFFPSFYLKEKMKVRNKQALKELPDFLDLVTVSIEAGLGFDGALSKVVAKKDGVLSKEFQRCLEEMRLGKTRREALTGIRNRLLVEDVRALIGSIIQAEQLGIGMVQIMRVQSNEIREKRKQRAEEQAMKAPIKMLFPLVMFIFPCIFIVLLGPAVIRLLEVF